MDRAGGKEKGARAFPIKKPIEGEKSGNTSARQTKKMNLSSIGSLSG